MNLIDKLGKDIVNKMKEKNQLRLSVLRMVKGAIQLENINNKKELNNELFIDVVSKQIKQRNESLEEFKKAERTDLAEKTLAEIEILKEYLPEQLSKKEIEEILNLAFDKIKPTSSKDMGAIMKEVTPLLKGKADMKEISNLIKEKLTNL